MERWVDICSVDEIPSRGARVVTRDGAIPIAIFRTGDDRVFALLDRCPHRGGPLSQGLVTGARVVCPLHGWTIDMNDGQAAAPDEGCVQAFDVVVESGCVRLRHADLVAPVAPAATCASASPGKASDAETPFPQG